MGAVYFVKRTKNGACEYFGERLKNWFGADDDPNEITVYYNLEEAQDACSMYEGDVVVKEG